MQCAGSRDENYLKHCSGVCCMGSLKQTRYVREQYPDAEIYIFYIDIRSPGRLEDFYAEVQKDEKLHLIKGKVAKVTEDAASGDLVVEAEDVLSGCRVSQKVDLVVLATGMVPGRRGGPHRSSTCGLRRDEHGFLTERSAAGRSAGGRMRQAAGRRGLVRAGRHGRRLEGLAELRGTSRG